MYCSNCGTKNENGDAFCASCGMPLNRQTEQTSYNNAYNSNVYNTNEKYNGFAIAGFVLSLVSFLTSWAMIPEILGLIFSCIGLNQIKQKGGKGRGLAIAGAIISGIFIGLFILGLILIIFGFSALACVSYS